MIADMLTKSLDVTKLQKFWSAARGDTKIDMSLGKRDRNGKLVKLVMVGQEKEGLFNWQVSLFWSLEPINQQQESGIRPTCHVHIHWVHDASRTLDRYNGHKATWRILCTHVWDIHTMATKQRGALYVSTCTPHPLRILGKHPPTHTQKHLCGARMHYHI